jgi:hypothetical protein
VLPGKIVGRIGHFGGSDVRGALGTGGISAGVGTSPAIWMTWQAMQGLARGGQGGGHGETRPKLQHLQDDDVQSEIDSRETSTRNQHRGSHRAQPGKFTASQHKQNTTHIVHKQTTKHSQSMELSTEPRMMMIFNWNRGLVLQCSVFQQRASRPCNSSLTVMMKSS